MQSKVTSISPDTLSGWMLSGKHDFLIVDVRDVDYLHERIKGALHAPSTLLAISLAKVADYILSLETQPLYTIFYCNEWFAFFLCSLNFFLCSIDRGPTAARTFSLQASSKFPSMNICYLEGGWSGWKKRFLDNPNLVC